MKTIPVYDFQKFKILNFFLAISLDLRWRMISKYVKFDLPKKFNPVKAKFWFFQWYLGSYPGKIPFLIFIFQVIYCYFIVLSIIVIKFGFLMHFGSEKLTQWPLILLSKKKLISNILYKNRLCYLKTRCDDFIIKGSWMAPYIAAWSMMYLLQIFCYTMK